MANDIYNRYYADSDYPYGEGEELYKTPKDYISSSLDNDFTGIVGVKRASMVFRENAYKNSKTYYSNEFEGHFYTFTNEDGSDMAHSGGRHGLERRSTYQSFVVKSYFYLQLKLPFDRKL